VVLLGLGNPGDEYAGTRHNAGFRVLDAARGRWGGARWVRRGQADESSVQLGSRRHRLVRPRVFMNCSGTVAAALLREGVEAQDLFVVLDDLDLPLGRLRIREGGGAGGHRGLASVLEAIRPATVARMRIGIGRPPEGETVDFVLREFTATERERFAAMEARALEALEVILTRGVAAGMNACNGRPAPWEESGPAAGPGLDRTAPGAPQEDDRHRAGEEGR
jgi:PTH1 family peptidyl-tRNA hydrolase